MPDTNVDPVELEGRPLVGKHLFCFGDSIICGHMCGIVSFATRVAEAEGMEIERFARNGGTVMPSPIVWGGEQLGPLGGSIVGQLGEVSLDKPVPDAVILDGGTNDCFPDVNGSRVGMVGNARTTEGFDLGTFTGWFERTLLEVRLRWPDAALVYVAVHKLGSRDWNLQLRLREVELAACARWDVTVADVFADTVLDTRDDAQRIAYSFDAVNPDGTIADPSAAPVDATHPSGTHPNLAAIDRFYVPVVRRALRRALA